MVTTRSGLRRNGQNPEQSSTTSATPADSGTTAHNGSISASRILTPPIALPAESKATIKVTQNPCPIANSNIQFACSICLDQSKNPVVTHCGHLFCWPCIYKWVYLHSPSRDCPVCKSPVDVGSSHAAVIPIYGIPSSDIRIDLTVPPRPTVKKIVGGLDVIAEELLDRARSLVNRASSNLRAIDVLLNEVSTQVTALRREGGSIGVEAVDVSQVVGVETRAARLRRTREAADAEVREARTEAIRRRLSRREMRPSDM